MAKDFITTPKISCMFEVYFPSYTGCYSILKYLKLTPWSSP